MKSLVLSVITSPPLHEKQVGKSFVSPAPKQTAFHDCDEAFSPPRFLIVKCETDKRPMGSSFAGGMECETVGANKELGTCEE